jgi:hypothetical protein
VDGFFHCVHETQRNQATTQNRIVQKRLL